MKIDLDSFIGDSKYFHWREALFLPSIKEYHQPSDEEIQNIRELCTRLDKVRELVGKPILVHCWIRPRSVVCDNPEYKGFDYNKHVDGAKNSAHVTGEAVDFHVNGLTVDQFQNILKPKCAEFKLAAEQNGKVVKRNWCHVQSRKLSDGSYRFYLP